MVLRARGILGDEMDLLKDGYILLDEEKIAEIGSGKPPRSEQVLDLPTSIIMPAFVDAHTHLGDSAFQDLGFGKSLEELFKPPDGLKHRQLRRTNREQLMDAIRATIRQLIRDGILTVGDFREGGAEGVRTISDAARNLPIRLLILARADHYFTEKELEENHERYPDHAMEDLLSTVDAVHGVAPSAPNDATDPALQQLASIGYKFGKVRVTHAAENPLSEKISKRRTGKTEVERAIEFLGADFVVHCVYATDTDLALLASRGASVVSCPRANTLLGLRLAPIPKMLQLGINVALGTDNVMLNAPDMFREMEYVLKAYSIDSGKNPLSPSQVIRLATINGARALGVEDMTGSIKEGKSADLIALDFDDANLRFVHDPIPAIVHRARASNISKVVYRGEIVYDRERPSVQS